MYVRRHRKWARKKDSELLTVSTPGEGIGGAVKSKSFGSNRTRFWAPYVYKLYDLGQST